MLSTSSSIEDERFKAINLNWLDTDWYLPGKLDFFLTAALLQLLSLFKQARARATSEPL